MTESRMGYMVVATKNRDFNISNRRGLITTVYGHRDDAESERLQWRECDNYEVVSVRIEIIQDKSSPARPRARPRTEVNETEWSDMRQSSWEHPSSGERPYMENG